MDQKMLVFEQWLVGTESPGLAWGVRAAVQISRSRNAPHTVFHQEVRLLEV